MAWLMIAILVLLSGIGHMIGQRDPRLAIAYSILLPIAGLIISAITTKHGPVQWNLLASYVLTGCITATISLAVSGILFVARRRSYGAQPPLRTWLSAVACLAITITMVILHRMAMAEAY